MGEKGMEGLNPGWETFDHVADIGIRGLGRTLDEAFSNGARALFSIMVESLDLVKASAETRVAASSFDLVGLFVGWLNELIAISDLEGMVFSRFEPRVSQGNLMVSSKVLGEPWNRERHGVGVEVKGATFSEARVEKVNGLWMAQCIVDV